MIDPKTIKVRKKVALSGGKTYWAEMTVYYNDTEEPFVEADLKPVGYSKRQLTPTVSP